MAIISKEFFRDPKKVGVPMITMNMTSGKVGFNLAAKERFNLMQFDYFVFARKESMKDKFFILPTTDKKIGWKLTKYTNQTNTYLQICSQQLVGFIARNLHLDSEVNQHEFYMVETDEKENGLPVFAVSLKKY